MRKAIWYIRYIMSMLAGDRTYQEMPIKKHHHFTVIIKHAIVRVDVDELHYEYRCNRLFFPWRKDIVLYRITAEQIGVRTERLAKFLSEPMYIPQLASPMLDERQRLNAVLTAYLDILIKRIQ